MVIPLVETTPFRLRPWGGEETGTTRTLPGPYPSRILRKSLGLSHGVLIQRCHSDVVNNSSPSLPSAPSGGRFSLWGAISRTP